MTAAYRGSCDAPDAPGSCVQIRERGHFDLPLADIRCAQRGRGTRGIPRGDQPRRHVVRQRRLPNDDCLRPLGDPSGPNLGVPAQSPLQLQ